METGIKSLKKKYGIEYTSYKYVMPGGEMLSHIGQVMVRVHYTRNEAGDWVSEFDKAFIVSMTDYEPLNMTYLCNYKLGDSEEVLSERVMPEGFSWVETGKEEDLKEMLRFMPCSLHYKLMEDAALIERVEELYGKRETLTIQQLTDISRSKERDAILRYSHNIGVAVKLDNSEGYLWIRCLKIDIRHKNGSKYVLKFEDSERPWTLTIDSTDKEYDCPELFGKIKIIDLAGE